MTTEPIAVWEGVTKLYPGRGYEGGVWALRGLDLRVCPGEVVGLLGPNRAGKTTVAKLLLSLCRPTEGRLLRFGRPISDHRTLGRIGYVHEDPAFPLDLNAYELLRYFGALSLTPASLLKRRIPELLDRFGLADRRSEPIGQFSKGMVQRLGIAQSLLNDPELLVMDEPAEGLDLDGRRLVRELIGELRSRGRSVLLISHSLSDVERLCDRAAVLASGRKVFDGPLESLKSIVEGPLEEALAVLYQRSAA
ncbi:MAG: ABC transporter ATP-binding protein [Isosphaeraceae bacterium]